LLTKGWSFLRPIRTLECPPEHAARKIHTARISQVLGANVLGLPTVKMRALASVVQ